MNDEIPAPLGVALQTHGNLLTLKKNLRAAVIDSITHTDHLKSMLTFVQERIDAFNVEVPK